MDKIKFIFNKKIVEIDFGSSPYTPNTTLLQFIRSHHNYKGTKEGCNEGDCGACTVVMIEIIENQVVYSAINSCVFLLPAVNGKQILTINDLEDADIHEIQKYFIEEHASQCGFCTPGFIMSAFAQKAQKLNSSKDDIVEAMAGNLCRCTGYQTIVNAAEKISTINNKNKFEKYCEIELLKSIKPQKTLNIEAKGFHYILPINFNDALQYKSLFPTHNVINGSTDIALKINKAKQTIYNIIDLSSVEDIKNIEVYEDYIKIGSGVSIEKFLNFCRDNIPQIAQYIALFGSKQIRNRATIGGNLGTASPIGDILPIMYALEAKVEVASIENTSVVDIDKFIISYRKTILKDNELIKNVIIPKINPQCLISAYKISKRTHLDISSVSACFNLLVEGKVIKSAKIAFGGMAATTRYAQNLQNYLIGKNFDEKTFVDAAEIAFNEFEPITDARSSATARRIFAKNLLIKFFEDNKSKI